MDLVEEEITRGPARELNECGQEAVHILGTEIAESIILKIDKEDVLADGSAGAEEASDELIEKVGFSGPTRAYDGENRAGRVEVRDRPFAGSQRRERRAPKPFGDDFLQGAVFHECLHR